MLGMKQMLWAALAVVTLIAGTGCNLGAHRWGCGPMAHQGGGCPQGDCDQTGPGGAYSGQCPGCGHGILHGAKSCRNCGKHCGQSTTIGGEPSGPPTGTVAYPYYTTRGPRDFLAPNPPSIGP
jgi:hypothetical protein